MVTATGGTQSDDSGRFNRIHHRAYRADRKECATSRVPPNPASGQHERGQRDADLPALEATRSPARPPRQGVRSRKHGVSPARGAPRPGRRGRRGPDPAHRHGKDFANSPVRARSQALACTAWPQNATSGTTGRGRWAPGPGIRRSWFIRGIRGLGLTRTAEEFRDSDPPAARGWDPLPGGRRRLGRGPGSSGRGPKTAAVRGTRCGIRGNRVSVRGARWASRPGSWRGSHRGAPRAAQRGSHRASLRGSIRDST